MIDPSAIDNVLRELLPAIHKHINQRSPGDALYRPFILGLSGLQGSGKSTWARAVADSLTHKHHINTVTLSLDDLYLTHNELVELRDANSNDCLLRTRGQPGTHDVALARGFFEALRNGKQDALLPAFDKSKFNGQGDRVAREKWQRADARGRLEVLLFEGWCIGFLPVSPEELRERWAAARHAKAEQPDGLSNKKYDFPKIANHPLEYLLRLNDNLDNYCRVFMGPQHLDALVHLDTKDLSIVYQWRLDQELALKKNTGSGMPDSDVIKFVDGYMPAYELYLERLQRGQYFDEPEKDILRRHLRIVLNEDRAVLTIEVKS